MAFMSQEKKANIAAALKTAVPDGWKYSLAVRHHSTIVLTIRSAPVDLVEAVYRRTGQGNPNAPGYTTLNHHWLERQVPADLWPTFEKILDALNIDNHDRSDISTDYFDVGHYVDLRIGAWDKPFTVN